MQRILLLDGAGTGAVSRKQKVNPVRVNGQPIPLIVYGTFVGTVQLWGGIGSEKDMNNGLVTMAPIENASWTVPVADGLFVGFDYLQAKVTAWTSGTISLAIGV